MKLLKLFAIGLLAGAATLSQALELRPYSASAFAEAKNAGKPYAVLFHADWCPTLGLTGIAILTGRQVAGGTGRAPAA